MKDFYAHTILFDETISKYGFTLIEALIFSRVTYNLVYSQHDTINVNIGELALAYGVDKRTIKRTLRTLENEEFIIIKCRQGLVFEIKKGGNL